MVAHYRHRIWHLFTHLDRLAVGGISIVVLAGLVWVLSDSIAEKIIVMLCVCPYTIYLFLLYTGKAEPEKNWLPTNYDGILTLIPAKTQLDLVLLITLLPLAVTLVYAIFSLGLGLIGTIAILQIAAISRRMNFLKKSHEKPPLPIDDIKQLQNDLEKQIQVKTEELYSEFRLMEDALVGSGIGVWELNLNTHKITGNPIYFNMMRLTPINHQVALQQLLSTLSDTDRAAFEQGLEQAKITQGEFHAVNKITNASGQAKWFRVTGVCKCDSQTKTETIMGTCLDITEYHQPNSTIENYAA